jgi:Cys-tRNA(Pro) deacylase
VPVGDDEARGVLAHFLVGLERNLDAVVASGIGALADEERLVHVEVLDRLRDALVYVTEDRLGMGDARFFSAVHRFCNARTPGSGARDTLSAMQQREWPEPVERVAACVREAGVEARIEEFDGGTPTAEAAAQAVGSKLEQIVKSLVFDCDGRPFVVLVPGNRRADSRKIARATGARRAKIVGPEEVQALTGFAAGAVAPFPLPKIERVLVDRQVLVHERVWIGAGSPRHMAMIAPADLVRLAKAEPMDAVVEAT